MVLNAPTRATKKAAWQLQEAKAMFSEVVQAAAQTPQIITVRGEKKAVILSYGEYQKIASPQLSLFEFMQASPLRDLELELPRRQPEKTRDSFL